MKTLTLTDADFSVLRRCLDAAERDAASKAIMIVNDGGEHRRLLREVEKFRARIEEAGEVRSVTPETLARDAVGLLKVARDHLKAAGAPRAADKVRLAMKSAEGAVRHAQGRASRAI